MPSKFAVTSSEHAARSQFRPYIEALYSILTLSIFQADVSCRCHGTRNVWNPDERCRRQFSEWATRDLTSAGQVRVQHIVACHAAYTRARHPLCCTYCVARYFHAAGSPDSLRRQLPRRMGAIPHRRHTDIAKLTIRSRIHSNPSRIPTPSMRSTRSLCDPTQRQQTKLCSTIRTGPARAPARHASEMDWRRGSSSRTTYSTFGDRMCPGARHPDTGITAVRDARFTIPARTPHTSRFTWLSPPLQHYILQFAALHPRTLSKYRIG
ncbi:hypothetical protein L227DRAFT_576859 [Lentinus tigrinus ALCF2SS1-6]|uniref:Uncharacterized protein n=2 Tax=Lentinus tigrinus TaxID=5365 RepID=A0A5C2S581_9APHY|nr:hypothetical protein L227DRAFT_576859 [Lentinus tigrinus ALCF2SS1-6]